MTINLNKSLVTKQGILTHIEDVDIYRFYSGREVSLNGAIVSPLGGDNTPSFGYFVGDGKEILFNDFRYGGGDCIKFVQLLFGLNYFEAMSKIVIDFNLTFHFFYRDIEKTSRDYKPNNYEQKEKILSTANRFLLGKRKREWQAYDLLFWNQFGIDIKTLKKFRVQPISHIFINGSPIKADKYAYCFIEQKDGKQTIKIYQPYSDKFKWINNHNSSVWQGWDQLPKKGKKLILTSSLKDVMTVDAMLGLPAVALQAEGVKPKKYVLEELHERFPEIILLYDNDFDKEINWGQKFADELCNDYDFLKNSIIPKQYKSKDISDLTNNLNKINIESFPDGNKPMNKKEKLKLIWDTNIVVPF